MPPAEIQVVLPDGSKKTLPAGATGADLARAVGPGLAKAALAIRVNGDVRDLQRPLPNGATVSILTNKDPQALDVLRHSSAHALATAVRQLFPQAQIGFGPPIEDGFYYDFDIGRPFTPEDITAIEKKMEEVVKADYPFEREEVSRQEAKRRFKDDPLKLERIDDLKEDEVISVYTDGPFVDLCRGPHVPSTGKIQHFKLLHAAGAYWRGDERRQMLQRIYGTAWFTKQDLDQYITRLEEARKRDHRIIGKQLDLFSIQEDVGPGLILWHPNGAILNFELRRFIEDIIRRRGYQLVYTPNVTREQLFLRSGHLHGMLRVRGLSMDDAHIFLREDQIEQEIFEMLDIVDLVMGKTFGLQYRLDLATRPDKKLGTDAMWDVAEKALEGALKRRGLTYRMDIGGGAFYGPKIDIKFNDAIGREWQGATIQLDYALPERFQLEYTGADNKPHRTLMMHRAIFGTIERFTGFLIEHFAGAFPLWLSPQQVRVLPIADAQLEAARVVHQTLSQAGMRSHLDERSETLNYKIRDAETHKVPYMAVVGQREAEARSVAVRGRGAGNKQVVLPVAEFVEKLKREVHTRSLSPLI